MRGERVRGRRRLTVRVRVATKPNATAAAAAAAATTVRRLPPPPLLLLLLLLLLKMVMMMRGERVRGRRRLIIERHYTAATAAVTPAPHQPMKIPAAAEILSTGGGPRPRPRGAWKRQKRATVHVRTISSSSS